MTEPTPPLHWFDLPHAPAPGTEVKAFVNRCAHFGVPLTDKQAQLIYTPHTSITCNVHYARYRWADGVCERAASHGCAVGQRPLMEQ